MFELGSSPCLHVNLIPSPVPLVSGTGGLCASANRRDGVSAPKTRQGLAIASIARRWRGRCKSGRIKFADGSGVADGDKKVLGCQDEANLVLGR